MITGDMFDEIADRFPNNEAIVYLMKVSATQRELRASATRGAYYRWHK